MTRQLTSIELPPCPVRRTGWEEYRHDGFRLVEYKGVDSRLYMLCEDGKVRIWYVVTLDGVVPAEA
jgi:hypothetical protein